MRAAVRALAVHGLEVERVSRLLPTAPLGPGGRRFANAALVARWTGDARTLLRVLKAVEREFGRRGGRRWGDRVLDLDILGLGDVVMRAPGLSLPHPALHLRRFVLDPLAQVAPDWRHPVQNATVRQLRARLLRPKRAIPRVGP